MNIYKHRFLGATVWVDLVLLGLWTSGCACSGFVSQQGQLATSLSGSALTFSHHQRLPQRFLVYNKDAAPLEIVSIQIVGHHAPMFQWNTEISPPVVLGVGKAQGFTLQVSFSGEIGSFAQARLEIFTTSDTTPSLSIALLSLEQKPWPVVACGESGDQDSLDFGAVVTAPILTRYCRLYNRGNAPMTLRRVLYLPTHGSPHAFRMQSPSLAKSVHLEPEQHILLQFVYDRTLHDDLVSIGSFWLESMNDKGQPLPRIEIVVKPLGKEPPVCFAVRPEHLDWGETYYGCFPPFQRFEILSTPSQDPRCEKAQVTGLVPFSRTASRFRVGGSLPLPYSWKYGDSQHVAVEYRPRQIGTDLGIVQIQTNLDGHPPLQVKVTGNTSRLPEQKDVFKTQQKPASDILMVIENSPAMRIHQKYVYENLQTFIKWAVLLYIDYRIGVITTDVSGKQYPPGCLQGSIKFITPQTPNPIETFLRNATVGTGGSNKPQPLEAIYRALQNPACHQNFLRKEASLSVGVISASPDVSPQSTDFYTHFFKQYKGIRNLDLIRVSVIVGPPPHGCQQQDIFAPSNPRLWEVAKELRGVQESLCNPNWSATLSNIGSIGLGYRTFFVLTKIPDHSTLFVTVNGEQVKEDPADGWGFDMSANAISFSKSQIPPPGSTVEVRYHPLCFSESKEHSAVPGTMR